MKVLLVIESLGQGGAEQSLMATIPLLQAMGIEAELIVVGAGDAHRVDEMRAVGVPVCVTDSRSVIELAKHLRRRIAMGDIDLVHATLFGPVIAAGLATFATGVPTLASVVNTANVAAEPDPSLSRGKLLAAHVVEALSLHLGVDHVHAVTDGVAASLNRHHWVRSAKVTVVERGRDPERFPPSSGTRRRSVRASLSIPDDVPLLLAVGRHEHQKGYDVLLDAYDRLQRRGGDAWLAIAGREGNKTAEIDRRRRGLPMPDRALILGNRSDMADLYGAADILVMSSWREGAAGAVIEAWATGTPVVATRVAGLDGTAIDGENAYLVPIGDDEALSDAIGEALADPAERARRAEAGRLLFLERFTVQHAAAEMVQLYRSTVGRRGRLRSLGRIRPRSN